MKLDMRHHLVPRRCLTSVSLVYRQAAPAAPSQSRRVLNKSAPAHIVIILTASTPYFRGTSAPNSRGTSAPNSRGTSAPNFRGTSAPNFRGTSTPYFRGTSEASQVQETDMLRLPCDDGRSSAPSCRTGLSTTTHTVNLPSRTMRADSPCAAIISLISPG